ncbi:MAG: RsmF rRNA methyltransferase first C-terminal domain-containing protein, partial [Eubacteriales bacterium]|nr:RsmF rRNA methyltransferase first C-terminal domain-containing protein [Eubacteriales bacterium]
LIREENLIVFGDALYALPVPAGTFSMDGLRVLRPGLHLGTLVRGRFEPAHALAMALRGEEVLRSVRIRGQSPEAYAWLRGEALAADPQTGKGWTLVLIDGCSAGWGKTGGNGVKNHYPKGLRRGNWFYESLAVHARSRS